MTAITTHVLDTALGKPASGVPVMLQRRNEQNEWENVGHGETDGDGRLRTLMPADAPLRPGIFRLVFDTQRYFHGHGVRSFYPHVIVMFEVVTGETHYHVPLLVSSWSYSTYRGN